MADIRRISDDQKKLQGQSRFVKNVPALQPIGKLWPVPQTLGKEGRFFFGRIGRQLVSARVLTELDRDSFTLLALAVDIIWETSEILKDEGYTVAGPQQTVKTHPVVRVRKSAFSDYIVLCSKFGLSPKDRSQIDLPKDPNPSDPHREFLFGKR